MARFLIAFLAGLGFGIGLTVSQMIDPPKILNFLDFAGIADGTWDPSLALVMAGALVVTAIGYRLAFRRPAPLLAPGFVLPARRNIDVTLGIGAALFGIGWGLVGYCPGPAIAALATGSGRVFLFVAAMLAGMLLHRFVVARPRPFVGGAPTR
jgi:uncharacterized membrane protein YedE/YeeE